MHISKGWKKGFVLISLLLLISTTVTVSSKNVISYSMNSASNDDAGYRKDAGNEQTRSLALYPGECIDDTPGRGRNGSLSSDDPRDWYLFSVCHGQEIQITVTPPVGFDINLSLWTNECVMVASSNNSDTSPEIITYTATYSGRWFMQVYYVSGNGAGQYCMDVILNGQNDANSGSDAPNVRTSALLLTPGTYYGYLDMYDPYDWYKIQVTSGQGIHAILKMKDIAFLTDFDLQLYNPSGVLIFEGNQYYDDEFNYPADVTGEWSIRVDIFPGWVDCPQPTEWSYYSYGSGAYNLTLILEASGEAPPAPVPQPEITPIAKTFKVANDPDSTKDDFGYLAAIPACNYLNGGQRYLAPIIYSDDTTPTAYYDDDISFGVVDDTTQYLLDDWNEYLALFGKTPEQYTLPADPIQAAAEIATQSWNSSQTAVVAVDGSGFADEVKTVLKKTATLRRKINVEEVPGNSTKINNIGGFYGCPLFLRSKWCALNVSMFGTGRTTPSLGAIFPLYMPMAQDWWPCPYDADGPKIDIFYPVTRSGVWAAGTDIISPKWTMKITKYAGHRYWFRVTNEDSSIFAQLTTSQPSDLLVFLIDPQGYLRAPDLPSWIGPVNPIHIWNGFENPSYNPWRTWHPVPDTEYTAEVLHPETGIWTVIVVPRDANGSNVRYTLIVDVKKVNQDRADAAVSAANAAVIASLHHLPLLYVTKDSVPAATQTAFMELGITKVIFVERGEIGAGVRSKLPTVDKDLITMQEIVDEIKSHPASENYITVTSLKTRQGFFAPAAMLAAYHGSPILRIEEASGNPAGLAGRIHTWRLWAGDYYHGGRDLGSLPKANEPIQITKLELFSRLIKAWLEIENVASLPPFGLDADRYWNEEMYQNMLGYIHSLGLDRMGQEGYCFVAPRNDIPAELHSTMMGNNSYAGDIPGMTPAYSSAHIIRSLLYPALIWVNPCRNMTTSRLINYRDSASWWPTGATGFMSRAMKHILQSHLRTYEGHCLWDASLQRMNQGASVLVYCGESTAGSGLSEQYLQTNYSKYPDQIWWDGWRGYMYDNWKTPRDNGMVWYNPLPPNLYDFIHYKWVDQQLQNLRSNAIFYASTQTGDGDGPLVYLDHGAVCWIGNQGTGYFDGIGEQNELLMYDVLIKGDRVGPALSKYIWVYTRDYTTGDPASLYSESTFLTHFHPYIYGDPDLLIYSPEWTIPIPIET